MLGIKDATAKLKLNFMVCGKKELIQFQVYEELAKDSFPLK